VVADHINRADSAAKSTKIRGHDAVKSMMIESRASGRMHHAWLLTGTAGIGKSGLARLAAAWLLSDGEGVSGLLGDDVPDFYLPPDDAGAALALSGAHPDLMMIEPAIENNKSGQIKIEQIRALIPFMAYKPGRGGWRVAIIDTMDAVNRNGANALLKLLEEPPEKTVLFLVASRPGKLPPTVRSRCRVVRMEALRDEDCHSVLRGIWSEADSEHLDLLVRLCAGAPGRAISLAETGAADCYQAACALLAAPKLDMPAIAALAGKWGRGGADGQEMRGGAIFCLDRLLHNAALHAAGVNTRPLCDFEKPAIEALCLRHSAATLAAAYETFLRESRRAESLYLDFSLFLVRQFDKLHEKSLP
jgi:DNA polymerase-3 subunit delta'